MEPLMPDVAAVGKSGWWCRGGAPRGRLVCAGETSRWFFLGLNHIYGLSLGKGARRCWSWLQNPARLGAGLGGLAVQNARSSQFSCEDGQVKVQSAPIP